MSWTNPNTWYWSVGDSSPGSKVWKAATGAFVVFSDSDYVAFLAAGNSLNSIDTLANLEIVIDSFNQTLRRPGYISVNISSGNYIVPVGGNSQTLVPRTINVSSLDTSGRSVVLGAQNLFGSIALGDFTIIINNDEINSLTVLLTDSVTEIALVGSKKAALIIPNQNVDNNGSWTVFYLSFVPI